MRRIYKAALMSIIAVGLFPIALAAQSTANAGGVAGVSHRVSMTVNAAALISLNDDATVELVANVTAHGSMDVAGSIDSSKRLRYTTIVKRGESRKITANWISGEKAPSGTSLHLAALGVPVGAGMAASRIQLNEYPQDLITNIGSFSTGNNGPTLQYALKIDDYAKLRDGENSTVTVVLTLADE